MMRAIFCLLLILAATAGNALCIVFVHIGSVLPAHLFVTISQARVFNPHCPIYLIASQEALLNDEKQLRNDQVIGVPYECLTSSKAHVQFNRIPGHNRGYNNLWVYTSERFFYLEEFMRRERLTDVVHLENDILLYRDLEELLPVFQKHYTGMIGATFINLKRGCAGIMYISDPQPLQAFLSCFSQPLNDYHNDMSILSRFDELYHKIWVDSLPVVMSEYPVDRIAFFSNHIDEFKSVFDGMALGIYTAGWDSRFHPGWAAKPRQVDVHTIFNASHFIYDWETDHQGRRIPFLIYEGVKWRINNLHLHNKSRIEEFHSLYQNN